MSETFIAHEEPATREGLPTLLVLHGTGGDEHSLVPIAQAVAPGYGILALRGRVDERGMPRFFRRFAEGVFDYDNIREETDAMASYLAPHAGNLIALAYSNGANMAWSLALRHPSILRGGILLRAMQTLDDQADLAGTSFFVSAGRYDPIVPVPNVEALVAQMQFCGADATLNWVNGGHELTRDELTLAQDWLARLASFPGDLQHQGG